MLSSVSYKKADVSERLPVKISGVSDKSNVRLSDYLREALKSRGLNYREVADKSDGLITHSTVYDLISGRNENPTISTLRGLSRGIGVPEKEVFDVARGAVTETSSIEAEIVSYFRALSEGRQKDLLDMAKVYYAGQEEIRQKFGAVYDVESFGPEDEDEVTGPGQAPGKVVYLPRNSMGDMTDETRAAQPARKRKAGGKT